jgi:hypothetical protein
MAPQIILETSFSNFFSRLRHAKIFFSPKFLSLNDLVSRFSALLLTGCVFKQNARVGILLLCARHLKDSGTQPQTRCKDQGFALSCHLQLSFLQRLAAKILHLRPLKFASDYPEHRPDKPI